MDHPNQQASAPTSQPPNNSTPLANQMSGADIQQAILQSAMAAQQGKGHGHSNSFAGQSSAQVPGPGHNHSLSLSHMNLLQQLVGMGGDNKNNSGNNTAAPFAHPSPPNSAPQAQSNCNNNIVSQLVATLQAQQQSQQQAQVQAAISRAFGPSSVGGGQQQQQPSNQNNLLSQMQLAQAQGLLASGNTNFFPNLGMANVQSNMLFKRAAMMAGGQDATKKQKLDIPSLQFGNGNLLSSLPGLPNSSLFPTSVPSLPNTTLQDNEAFLHQKLAGARGAVIVPCRARGMPVDHNFKTAYFVIPDGIEHGDELVCSFPACRQAGVKFRYCVDCKVPVAKRNFRNRHRHGVPGGDEGSISGDDEESGGEEEEAKEQDPTNGEVCLPASDAVEREHLIVIPDKGKKKKTKSVRVPCRARGMPMAHNFKTAHFIIPPNIQHGDELVCSFPPCRAAGAKFRYCLHCKVPVAKRNFRNRHKHGNLGEKKKASPTQEDEDVNEETGKVDAESKSDEERRSSELTEDVAEDDGDLKPSASPVKSADSPGQTTVAISSNHDPTQVQQWVSLLDTKPDPSDKQAMAVWMMNLMHATDAMSSKPSSTGADASATATVARSDSNVEAPKLPVKCEEEETRAAVNSEEPAELKSEEPAESKSEESTESKS